MRLEKEAKTIPNLPGLQILKGLEFCFKELAFRRKRHPRNNSVKEEPGSDCNLERPEGCEEDGW